MSKLIIRIISFSYKTSCELITEILFCREWSAVQQYIKTHPDFDQYFYECPEDIPWIDCDFGENNGTKIPYDVLETPEAETVFKNHINALQQEQRRLE